MTSDAKVQIQWLGYAVLHGKIHLNMDLPDYKNCQASTRQLLLSLSTCLPVPFLKPQTIIPCISSYRITFKLTSLQ